MTEQENLRTALDGGNPEHIPCFWAGGQIVTSSVIGNLPSFEHTEGYDAFGVHWTATESSGWMFSPTVGVPYVLEDVTEWKEKVRFPDIDAIDWEAAGKKDMANVDSNRLTNFYAGNGLFERLHLLMGFENAMMAILDEPEAVYELVGAIADMYVKITAKIGEYYKPEYYTFLDDYAHKSGAFISPKTFDEFFAPHLQKIVETAEKGGMKFILHCCGQEQIFIDNFYKIGIRRLEPCQPCNDLAQMKKKHPDIALMGGLDLQRIVDYPGVTEEQLRKEVRRCIDEYGPLGGYSIYGCSVSMYNPSEYAPDRKMGILIDESIKSVKK